MSRESFEELHGPTRSSWALWIIVCIVVLFGGFWLLMERSIRSKQASRPIVTSPTAPLESLQAAVIESVIPDFSEGF